ncbi:MAG: phosphate acyltransferase PlsX [Bacteroidales bacterium]
MKIGIDAMGGDHAPSAVIEGVIEARKSFDSDDTIILIGDSQQIHRQLDKHHCDEDKIQVVHASEIIEMDDQPTKAFNSKQDSSISVGFQMLKNGDIDSFASAGNTGAMLVGSFYQIGVIQGLLRPTTAALIPRPNGGTSILLDVGTNPDVKPDVLNQFAILGSVFAEFLIGVDNPKVALLNIGAEEKKGNILIQSTYPLLKQNQEIDFIGNIEGRDIFSDQADVIVCDGFTGNIVLKQLEAFHQILVNHYPANEFTSRMDFENFGATPVIGINKPVLIGHGVSGIKAFKSMVISSKRLIKANLKDKIRQKLAKSIVL